ncbi:UDP-N-acetylmuramyl pentapeptide phosphotransferase [Microbacterium sp. P01]|uniref:UDP-N-acetylmuramyl pentapeptide phosphotransferase n=1 Tax=unclassified Microbacterium TaxID=2609290 RepID=UPI00366C8B20
MSTQVNGSMIGGSAPQTGAQAVIADAIDPARRPDVFFRVRRDEGHQMSAWWMIGAFVGVSITVVALLSLVPGGI